MDAERATGAEGGGSAPCGIIPLTLIDIFAGLEEKRREASLPNEKWSLAVQYLEVYNEKVSGTRANNGKARANNGKQEQTRLQ